MLQMGLFEGGLKQCSKVLKTAQDIEKNRFNNDSSSVRAQSGSCWGGEKFDTSLSIDRSWADKKEMTSKFLYWRLFCGPNDVNNRCGAEPELPASCRRTRNKSW